MNSREREKIDKLIQISRMYYEQDMKQSEIAKAFSISRPLISRMLREARDMGIVRIEIGSPEEGNQVLMNQVCSHFSIAGGILVPNGMNDVDTNDRIAGMTLEFLQGLKQENFGLGWGHIIGTLISEMERREAMKGMARSVCPLMGNSEVSTRNYHSNELVRIFASRTDARPEYIYAPAFVTMEQELKQFQTLENYHTLEAAWRQLDVAIVNIGNYPSTPDFASEARYGDALRRQRAVGRVLNYFYNVKGEIIQSDMDYAIRIPLEILKDTRFVIGLCSSHISEKAVLGALRTGYLTHLIAPEIQVRKALQMSEESREQV
ncbi:transcriptional regulator [Ruminococcus sp. OA3]|uniref:sugar-binding transcriptional regulator n=1 Tax=Ruminococcus sp. OA3 TaxID=2914164 RepID=UPI001F06DB46|nr:sugar-binding domain-containing protein [Ruminococcus sp. OA3]MCH1981305.1 transcriptional regulator [Ruminococcus sp. OA3]